MRKLHTSLSILTLIGSLALFDCSSDDAPPDTQFGAFGGSSGSAGSSSVGPGGAAVGGTRMQGGAEIGGVRASGAAGGDRNTSPSSEAGPAGAGGGSAKTESSSTAIALGGAAVGGGGVTGTAGIGGSVLAMAGAGGVAVGLAGAASCVPSFAGAAGSPPVLTGATIHVVAGATLQGANGSVEHPFPQVSDAAVAIRGNLEHCIAWDGRVVVHKGRYEVVATVELPPSVDVEFQAGVTMAMGSKVSFHANRDVKVLGTQAEPVVFTWLTQDKPWGSFTLFVPTSQANVFTWATFEHGGQVTYQGISVRGALSLVGAGGRMSNCTFQNNSGDDGLSLGNSPIKVNHCSFLNNSSDGIDVGGTSGGVQEISFCTFDGNGQDGLDLGDGCDTWVHDNVLTNNGDNGIEIGEACVPRIERTIAVGNVMGIAIRDDSDPVVTNCTVYGNQFGIVGYRWKEAFGEGKGRVSNTIVWGSTVADIVIEPGATTAFSYSCIQSSTSTDTTDKKGGGNIAPLVGTGLVSKGAGCDDPLFVDPGIGDFHLRSAAGRYDPESGRWVASGETSPCIDAGDPLSPVGNETAPNGGRINLGAYGGTAEASRSTK